MAQCAARYKDLAAQAGAAVLVPFALAHTWDFIHTQGFTQGGERGDVAFLSFSMNQARRLCRVDDSRVALLGYSDGASFGLSLALHNPDVFQAAMVWAAGFFAPPPGPPPARPPERGARRPRLLLWHGTEDAVFDYRTVSLPLRERLLRSGYALDYRAEEGGRHVCPEPPSSFCEESLGFWLAS